LERDGIDVARIDLHDRIHETVTLRCCVPLDGSQGNADSRADQARGLYRTGCCQTAALPLDLPPRPQDLDRRAQHKILCRGKKPNDAGQVRQESNTVNLPINYFIQNIDLYDSRPWQPHYDSGLARRDCGHQDSRSCGRHAQCSPSRCTVSAQRSQQRVHSGRPPCNGPNQP